jgi:hypothetical protein
MGRSAGFPPFTVKSYPRSKPRGEASQGGGAIGHQRPGFDKFLLCKHARQPFLYREVSDLLSVVKSERILQDEEWVWALLAYHGQSALEVLQA